MSRKFSKGGGVLLTGIPLMVVRKKIQAKKYYFFMEKFNFQNVELGQNFMQFAKY